ncbi:MAG TPA: cytochrome c oxidase assembly protein [Bryobacteraceae bacterium]|nr:cytochrome c oxidase assembly protein [Bryobacteraceae bacterium]
MAEAVLRSWRFDLPFIAALLLLAILYVRGWLKLHRETPHRYTQERLASFFAGLLALFLALASPLDAFGNLLLEAHMIQHLLLIMVAPPLILIGQPVLPLLRGLPRRVFKDGLGPFLAWHGLRRAGRFITHPVFTWLPMTAAIVFWHAPRWYDLGLNSPGWHGVEHASFFYAALLFWWPIVQVWPGTPQWPRWAMIPYLVLADFVNTALSAWLVFSSHVVYRTYEMAPRLGSMSALEDQSTAGAIMWVPGSIAYLIPAFVLTMQVLNGSRPRPAAVELRPIPKKRRQAFDLLRVPVVGRMLRHRYFRRALQFTMFGLAATTVVDGLAGPQIAPLNLSGILPWTYWRGFVVIALLAAGNLFCLACPFTLARDLGRRILPARYRWPAKLRSKWLAASLLIVYFWAYEVFSLWESPWWTAWVILGYFVTAFVIDGMFQGASFCKYICPIGQFNFINSLVSPLEVKIRSEAACKSCSTYDCIRGNPTQRGCELYLFQPRKSGNFDCTFCLDCVQACPHDNVGIIPTVPVSAILNDHPSSGVGNLTKRADASALAWILIFAGLVNAAAMVDPIRERMHSLAMTLGFHSTVPLTTGLFVFGLIAAPLLLAWLCGVVSAHLGHAAGGWAALARRFGFTLIPLGLSMWVAHFLYHVATGWRSIVPVIDRILQPSMPAAGLLGQIPPWLVPVQILILDAGFVFAVYLAWRAARRETARIGTALGLFAPWLVLGAGLYALAVWTFFQPMQMRGMVM